MSTTERVIIPMRGTTYVEVTQGDSAIEFDAQLLGAPSSAYPNGVPQSLAGVLSVSFSMKRKIDGAFLQTAVECTIVDAAAGRVTVRPLMTTRGLMLAQFRVVFADGSELSFPNGWDLRVRIRAGVRAPIP